MFTVVLLTALTAGENVAEFHPRGGCYGYGCYGCSGCYGGYGSCYGCGGGYAMPYYGGCCGGCYGGCYGSCYGGSFGGCWGGCHGGACYGSCYGSCYGMGYTCAGGCWGMPYGCYGCSGGCYGVVGYGCGGGCGGYMSPAYGVPSAGVGIPIGAAIDPTKADEKKDEMASALGNRARLVFTLPEGAKLFIDGAPVEVTAERKSFRTPELKPGTKYFYEARVEVEKEGKKAAGTRKIYVSAGQTVEEDLTTVELKPDVLVSTAN